MSINKILKSYSEFQTILTLLNIKYEINENLNVVEIKTNNEIELSQLVELKEIVESFEIYCNPFPDDIEDVIDDIQRGNKDIQELISISIHLEKSELIESRGNLDYFFFDTKEAIRMLSEMKSVENNKINIGIPNIVNLETETAVFHSLHKDFDLEGITKKPIDNVVQNNIIFYLSNNKKTNQTIYNNPYSFIMVDRELENDDFVKLVKHYFYLTMLDCLSDKIEDDHYILRGEKTVSIKNNIEFKTENYIDFINIFNFLISEKKYTEKFIIIKKVFSLYIMDDEDINDVDTKINKIWKTVNHYYDHYVEENIKDFFKTKDQLLKEAMNVSKVVYEQTDKVNTSIIASIFSVIILIVTTLFRSINNISFVYFLSIILIFFVFSAIYYYLMANSSNERYKLTKSQFEYFINEITLMQPEEIKELQNTYLEQPYTVLKRTLRKLLGILIGINLLLIIAFLIFLCVVHNICLC
ncbi:hypothetical protein [Lysinibacillus capsici]|uniref:hypothetical protein n=1 Tax=Lysinibacillus capsici TaxID=2115968 RepID=UPI00325FA837